MEEKWETDGNRQQGVALRRGKWKRSRDGKQKHLDLNDSFMAARW